MKKILWLSITVMLFISSCSFIYVPNAANIPLIGQKGEAQASVLAGTSNFDAQGAYGITDKISVMVNTSFSNRERGANVKDSSVLHKHSLAEAAFGYYKKIGRSGRLEVYGGGGYGNTEDFDKGNNSFYVNANGKYAKFFIQPNIGSVSNIFDGGMSLRFCYVNYFDFNYSNIDYTAQKSMFIEPVLTGKIGYKNVKFITQFGFSIPVLKNDLVTFNPLILNIGLNFKINTIKSKPIVQ